MSDCESRDGHEHADDIDAGLHKGCSTLEALSPEILGLMLDLLPAKTLLNLSETSRKLHSECIGNDGVWKSLLKVSADALITAASITFSDMFARGSCKIESAFYGWHLQYAII